MIRFFLVSLFFMLSLHAASNIWTRAGEAYGIDPRLLYSISKVESDRDPLMISVNYKKLNSTQLNSLYNMLKRNNIQYKTFTKVVEIKNENIYQAKHVINFLDYNKYPSFDIGLMQINNIHKSMLTKLKISLPELLNQETNLKIAASILWECYKKHRSTDKAINAYNGRLVGNPYYGKVYEELRKHLLPHEGTSKRLFYRII